ncbi:aminotransferase class V-fold PLP-dependent enzyme [Rhodobacteraceae bacterium]|nr:aminotransferase class V-fold PLP-dependent enzyme [Paracoccaceae bacterium]
MMLDPDFIRAQFPAFSEPSLAGQAFFENAGGSYPCRFVTDRLERFYRERKVQPYGPFHASRVAGKEMDEAHVRLSAMLGVDQDELSFGPSTTQNTYVMAQAFRQFLPKGAAIVVTNQDHEANSGPWRRLAEAGIEVREWQVDPTTGHLALADLDRLLDGAALLCVTHCSNVVGEINDIPAITKIAHDAGASVCVDGVSYAPHGLPDVGALGADIYLFSAYKTYGPHQGIMVVRRALGEALPNQGHYFNGHSLYKKFTPAGPDHAQVAACAGMADYVDALYAHMGGAHVGPKERAIAVHDAMRAREIALLDPLMRFLNGKNSLRVLGPTEAAKRAPTIALEAERSGEDLAAELARHGINTGGGDFYAGRALEAMGIDLKKGALRVSFTHYTSEAEINCLIEALDRVI